MNKPNSPNQKGFTLIEVMISLVITGLIVSLCTFPMLRLLDHGYMNQTLVTFKSDLNLVRQHNMIPGSKKLQLKVSSNQTEYVIQYSTSLKTYLIRSLPPHIKIKIPPTAPITFNERGNIGMGKTIPITSRYNTKTVVFSIGTGGLDIR